MRVFQLAAELIPDCFGDAGLVRAEPITEEIAGQLYSAVCSIEANISEAYSRSSGKIERCDLSTHWALSAKA
jgi:hypothetical protein